MSTNQQNSFNNVDERKPSLGNTRKAKIKPERRSLCLFKRSSGNILNLRYSSKVLEDHYQECSLTYATYRYKGTCIYSIIASVCWLIYVILRGDNYVFYVVGFVGAVLLFGLLFGLAFAETLFKKHHSKFYLALALTLAFFSLLSFATTKAEAFNSLSLIFNQFLTMQTILLLYTMVPVRLWQAMVIGIGLSVFYMFISVLHYGVDSWRIIIVMILLELMANLVGLVHHLTSQARRRSTFLKLGQTAELKLRIKNEQMSQEEMIQSLMPLDVAREVMASKNNETDDENANERRKSSDTSELASQRKCCGMVGSGSQGGENRKRNRNRRKSEKSDADSSDDDEDINLTVDKKQRPSRQLDIDANDEDLELQSQGSATQPSRVTFRKFHVNQMLNVSILFADIVGFTKMSSNKSAPHLVSLLNDLFGSFDKLCEMNGCEKIATLGDCYYCVSGCPKSTEDHAERCVEMGRSMCVAIQQFDQRHNEEVNMRVGVHTGTVICGIVGTHRFKFDVWSHDVTLANEMESSGDAGRVHISAETYAFVKDIYQVDSGKDLDDFRKLNVLTEYFDDVTQSYAIKHVQEKTQVKTYFIVDRFDKKEVKLIPLEEQEEAARKVGEKRMSIIDAGSVRKPSNSDAKPMVVTDEVVPPPNTDNNNTTTADGVIDARAGNTEEQNQKLRDEEIVQCLKDDPIQTSTLFKPSINYCTLTFKNSALERRYRRVGLRPHKKQNRQLTWANHRITPLINEITNFIFTLIASLCCFIAFPVIYNQYNHYIYRYRVLFYVLIAITYLLNAAFIIPMLIDFIMLTRIPPGFQRVYRKMYDWTSRNLFLVLILDLPIFLVIANIDRCFLSTTIYYSYRIILGIMLLFGMINFTLFSLCSSWCKTMTAISATLLACVVLGVQRFLPLNSNCVVYAPYLQLFDHQSKSLVNVSRYNITDYPIWLQSASNVYLEVEILISLGLALVFIIFFNRELDISFRASFSCDHGAREARTTIAKERRQADWLLENIIPRYVIEPVKINKSYSQHMEQVGVIFATIANFGEFYDEQFEGGREMLRVLNEIFADFEHLLTKKKYGDIEKIKTIGSCFMAASGLNPDRRRMETRNPNQHLYALMDFCVDLISTLNDFNQQLFNFDFELKIGYNIGDVTAGVIGTTKLLYDIWGDTVNVASRMYSTGSKGKIQVPEAVAQKLEDRFEFEYRGEVEVKGKGLMKTYLFVGKKARNNT